MIQLATELQDVFSTQLDHYSTQIQHATMPWPYWAWILPFSQLMHFSRILSRETGIWHWWLAATIWSTRKCLLWKAVWENYKCFNHYSSIQIPCPTNTTSVQLSIQSNACMFGTCGPFGACLQYVSGGFMFTTCACRSGNFKIILSL